LIHLAFVWHLHQPWYRDPSGGKLLLPWVRLHATSAYRDMAVLLEAHPGVRATVSFSPALLDQLEAYASGRATDTFEELTAVPAAELTDRQREDLLRTFFSVHWGRVLDAMPRYRDLLGKRGREVPARGFAKTARGFTAEELRDLQVLFNLAWFGPGAAREPEIAELLARGRDYTEEDKAVILSVQRRLLGEVLPAWRRLFSSGAIELCTCPYYHPILPLLIDSDTARRPTPDVILPERFSYAEDTDAQIALALVRLEQGFGVEPRGLWPPEGAISPETVDAAVARGVRHLVADEEILFRSFDERGSSPGRRRLYQPYAHRGAAILFRDARLSNRIAKEYARWEDPRAAAHDFIAEVRKAAEQARMPAGADPLVVVALDGENPWEAFPKRGEDFLSALYEGIAAAEGVCTVTLDEHLAANPPRAALDHLHSGSWIEGNFAVWIGDPEKNRAWSLLSRARRRLQQAQEGSEAGAAQLEHAHRHLLKAEGSDWFRKLGEPFSSAEDPIYDALFRAHVTAVYRAIGASPPAALSRPIEDGEVVAPLRPVTALITPRLDGRRTSFFEWNGAGLYRAQSGGSSLVGGLYWGFDDGRLYLRFDPAESSPRLERLEVWFELTGPGRKVIARLLQGAAPALVLTGQDAAGGTQDLGTVAEVVANEVVDLAIPLSRLGWLAGTRLGLSLHFAEGGVELASIPKNGAIEVELPDADADALP
jgi:alpha-amylase/alpha-mannosidase (GH57 family)